jgi:hypothetical protein
MAKWPQTGSRLDPAYTREAEAVAVAVGDAETTLVKMTDELGLASLSKADEAIIRHELGALIAAYYQNLAGSEKRNPNRVTVVGVLMTLRRLADLLEAAPWESANLDLNIDSVITAHADLAEIERLVHGHETGLRSTEELAVAGAIMKVLEKQIGNYDQARAVLLDYQRNPRPVAEACRKAAKKVGAIKGKRGAPSVDWSGFRRALTLIANRNNVKPKIVINRANGKVEGRYIEIAEGLQRLLPKYMRALNRTALAKRLQRAKGE